MILIMPQIRYHISYSAHFRTYLVLQDLQFTILHEIWEIFFQKKQAGNQQCVHHLLTSRVRRILFYICWFLEVEICSSQQSLNVFNGVCNEILFVNHNSTFRFKLSITTLVSGFHHQPSNTKEDDVDSERSKGLCVTRHKRLCTLKYKIALRKYFSKTGKNPFGKKNNFYLSIRPDAPQCSHERAAFMCCLYCSVLLGPADSQH